jgi:hypothetical protein
MQRDQLPRLRQAATFVIPRWKIVYVSNPKAACTSIKWLLADLQGADHQPFYDTLKWETSRDGTIHHGKRNLWPGTPRLSALSDEKLAEITPDNGWFVFTASRHPASRVWSAWQSKLLIRQPRYAAHYADEPWFPRVPQTSDDVIEDWFRFVEHLRADPPVALLAKDVHFRPQAEQLSVGRTPYDRIYDTGEFKTLLTDLTAHLRGQGWQGELHVRRSNETPLAALSTAYPEPVLETIQDVYRADYEAFDYPMAVPRGTRDETSYSPDLIAAVGILIERHERIGDLSRRAKTLQRRLRQSRSEPAAPRRGRTTEAGRGAGKAASGRRFRRRRTRG